MAGRALTPEEVVRLINAPDRSKAEGARDHALLLVLARTSLRVSEVRNLRVSSIVWSHGRWTARVKVKGGRESHRPLSEAGRRAPATPSQRRRRRLHLPADRQLPHARIRQGALGPAYLPDRRCVAFQEFFTISVTKMSAMRFASQKPMLTGPFDGQKSPVYW
jgi:integrase